MNFRGPYLTLDLCLYITVFRIQKKRKCISLVCAFFAKIVSVHFNERSAQCKFFGTHDVVNGILPLT